MFFLWNSADGEWLFFENEIPRVLDLFQHTYTHKHTHTVSFILCWLETPIMELFFSNWYPGPILLSSFLISPSYYILAFILTTFHSSKFHNVTRAYGSYLLNIETGPCSFSSSFVIEENWFLSFFLFISFFFFLTILSKNSSRRTAYRYF